MPIMFNSILREAELDPSGVRLLRHKDTRATKGRSPYELWRDDRPQFEIYQSLQASDDRTRTKLAAAYWAVFLIDFDGAAMFGGLYRVNRHGLLECDTPDPSNIDSTLKAGEYDKYELVLDDKLKDFIGKLYIDWGEGGERAWIQRADNQDKPVIELRPAFREEDFPGFLNFIQPLSKLNKLPKTWEAALRNSRGVYLLTCPRTKEQYVGSATGEEGFWGRWQEYLQTGHGGNVALKSREPSDYQVSILEVAGTSARLEDILAMEGLWQRKLQSKEMGLNRNLAGRV